MGLVGLVYLHGSKCQECGKTGVGLIHANVGQVRSPHAQISPRPNLLYTADYLGASRMLGRVLILVISMACLSSPGFAKDVIAVLEPTGPLDRSILMKLSDESRAAAVNTLPKDDYRVITRENMLLILRDMGVDPSCVEGECEVETGRNVGAKYVISGNVIHVRNTWMFTLKLHETDKGALLGTSEARGPDELVLIDKVQEATRALIGRAILGDESEGAVASTAPAPVASYSPSQAFSSVDFGGVGRGLDVPERLRQQRCDETAKVDGEQARAARLAVAEQEAQTKARTAWSGQSAELEMCASLKRAERDGCIEVVEAWLGVARAMVVSIPAGVESIETECGTRQPVYEAVERTVVASDVKKAESLLVRLQSAGSVSSGGGSVVAGAGAAEACAANRETRGKALPITPLQKKVQEKRHRSIDFLQDLLRNNPPQGEQKADMLLRLGTLYFEEGKANHNDPTLQWFEKSIKLYRLILRTYPQSRRADEALFYLASALQEICLFDDAVKEVTKLVRLYPQSRFTPDAYVMIGEYYFENNNAYKALLAYRKATKHKNSPKYVFALYKLAWCYYNVGEYSKAIDTMKAAKREAKSKENSNLVKKAQMDLVEWESKMGE